MEFLKELNFDESEITHAENNVTDLLMNELVDKKQLVIANLSFLKDYGIKSYKDIFINYSRMFLIDHSKFKKIFTKYDKSSLIEKLNSNLAVVEFL